VTITEQQLDAVLPRVPAGLPCGGRDLTDADERAETIAELLDLYRRAETEVWVRYTDSVGDLEASEFDCIRCDKRAVVCAWTDDQWGGEAFCDVHDPRSAPAHVHWGTNQATVVPDPEIERLLDEEEWYRRNRRNGWTDRPPQPGTHESDVLPPDLQFWKAGLTGINASNQPRGGVQEFNYARDWSVENAR